MDEDEVLEVGSELWRERAEEMFEIQRAMIAEGEWAVQIVFGGNHSWAYTVGNYDVGLPELLMTGGDVQALGGFLNHLTRAMREGTLGPIEHGGVVNLDDRIEFRAVNIPQAIVEGTDTFNVWWPVSGKHKGIDDIWAFQLVWPGYIKDEADAELSYPTTAKPWRDQPVLGEVWWDA